jgi:hypothetical protein
MAIVLAFGVGIALVYGLTYAGDQSAGPLEDMLTTIRYQRDPHRARSGYRYQGAITR